MGNTSEILIRMQKMFESVRFFGPYFYEIYMYSFSAQYELNRSFKNPLLEKDGLSKLETLERLQLSLGPLKEISK